MAWLAVDGLLYLTGLVGLAAHGLPPLLAAGALGLLWWLSGKLFRLGSAAASASLLLLPW